MGSRPYLRVCPLIAGTEKATPKASRLKAKGYLNGLKQNAEDIQVILYASAETARAVGYNPFMPSYPHIEEYRVKLQELIEFGGSDNEENIRPAFQNCLDAYCHDHRERLALIPELKTSPGNKPDGTVKDSLRMARGYWEAKDSHDDLDAEIKVKFNRGYPRDNIIFEDSQTAVLVQNGNEAMRVDMSRDGELHRLIRIFLDYELPEIQEFRHAQSQFKTDLPTVLENLRATVAEAEADNPEYQEAASSFLDLCRRTIGPAVSPDDVREMLLQHILTKDIFLSIFPGGPVPPGEQRGAAAGQAGAHLLHRRRAAAGHRPAAGLLRSHRKGRRRDRRLRREATVPQGDLRGLLYRLQPGRRRPAGGGLHAQRGGGLHHPGRGPPAPEALR